MEAREFTKKEIEELIRRSKSEDINYDEIFRERLKGCYIVYGDDDSREFLDYIDNNRKSSISGIAIKVNTIAGDYYLVRALKNSHDSNYNTAMELAQDSKVAGGKAFLGTVDQWLEMYDNKECLNNAVASLRKQGIDAEIFKNGWHRTSRAVNEDSAIGVDMGFGKVGYDSRINGSIMFVLLFSAFKC